MARLHGHVLVRNYDRAEIFLLLVDIVLLAVLFFLLQPRTATQTTLAQVRIFQPVFSHRRDVNRDVAFIRNDHLARDPLARAGRENEFVRIERKRIILRDDNPRPEALAPSLALESDLGVVGARWNGWIQVERHRHQFALIRRDHERNGNAGDSFRGEMSLQRFRGHRRAPQDQVLRFLIVQPDVGFEEGRFACECDRLTGIRSTSEKLYRRATRDFHSLGDGLLDSSVTNAHPQTTTAIVLVMLMIVVMMLVLAPAAEMRPSAEMDGMVTLRVRRTHGHLRSAADVKAPPLHAHESKTEMMSVRLLDTGRRQRREP